MKRKLVIVSCCIVLIGVIAASVFLLTRKEDKPTVAEQTVAGTQTVTDRPALPETTEEQATAPSQPALTAEKVEGEVMTEKSADLDGDGQDETIQILKRDIPGTDGQYDGFMVIRGKDKEVTVPFPKKSSFLTGLFSSIDFQDLDGDGAKDVFILLPDNGAQFNFSYFFMVNYKTGKSYAYQENGLDKKMTDYAASFNFSYQGKGILAMKSDALHFDGKLDVEDSPVYSEDETANQNFDRAWVDPTPVEMGVGSGLSLSPGGNLTTMIKVPLPIFGQATADILGRVDFYFSVNADFVPVLKRMEVVRLTGNTQKVIGSKDY